LVNAAVSARVPIENIQYAPSIAKPAKKPALGPMVPPTRPYDDPAWFRCRVSRTKL
jgi:hypothetical protein